MTVAPGQMYVFGPFRYDSTTGQLWRNDHSLRVPEQASRILACLLEHHGTTVTRETLRKLLWPDGEHVDYDHSISNSISRLRAILRDDLKNPAYISTVSKRGYQFVAPVRIESIVPSDASAKPLETGTTTPTDSADEYPLEPNLVSGNTGGEPPTPGTHPLRWQLFHRYGWIVGVILVVAIAAAVWRWNSVRREREIPPDIYMGIAPFTVLSGERTLADSFRLDVADALSLLPGVRVKAANSFPDGAIDEAAIRRLGEEAHLDVILLGQFLQKDREVTLAFELVRARDAVHLGSFHYSGSVDDLASIRDRVQREVFARLDLVRYATHPVSAPTIDTRAYEIYLRARYDLLQQTDESLKRAIEGFKTVTGIDPHFAKAYSGMANAYVTLAEHDGMPVREGYLQGMALARKALELDTENAEAHALLGFAALGPDWDLGVAEKELRRAIELDPNSAHYHLWLAVLFGEQARFEEGYRQIDLARAADPFWPLVNVEEAFIASSARDNSRMVDAGNRLLALKPDWSVAYDEMGWIYWYAGQPKSAAQQWRTMAQLDRDPQRVELETTGLKALNESGTVAYARLRLKAIDENVVWKHGYHDFLRPEWTSCAGEHDAALRLLQEMVAHRDPSSLSISVNPMYDGLRSDPRFNELLSGIYGPASFVGVQKRLEDQLRGKEMNLACPLPNRPRTRTRDASTFAKAARKRD
jgi:DNA-binding winged helix-turn-helix (wHTH) protein/TolB-like protein